MVGVPTRCWLPWRWRAARSPVRGWRSWSGTAGRPRRGKVKTDPAQGWNLVSRQLKLDGDVVDSPVEINGEKLATGSDHVLLGKGVFRRGNDTVTVTEKLKFEACPN